VLGYCIFPLNIAAVLCYVVPNSIFRALAVTAGCVWSSRGEAALRASRRARARGCSWCYALPATCCAASVVFMSQLVSPNRKALAVYPVFLFYIVLSWVILVGSYAK
jgi:hypothetical protein